MSNVQSKVVTAHNAMHNAYVIVLTMKVRIIAYGVRVISYYFSTK